MSGSFIRLLAFVVLAALVLVSSCNAYRFAGAPASEAVKQ